MIGNGHQRRPKLQTALTSRARETKPCKNITLSLSVNTQLPQANQTEENAPNEGPERDARQQVGTVLINREGTSRRIGPGEQASRTTILNLNDLMG